MRYNGDLMEHNENIVGYNWYNHENEQFAMENHHL